MDDVTQLLSRWNAGDRAAMAELLDHVHVELRRLAGREMRREREGHTLQPTALVNELYLKFSGLRSLKLENRRHFFGAAAEAMRRILVDHARRRRAEKRGGAVLHVTLDEVGEDALAAGAVVDIERLNDALDALRRQAPDRAAVVDLRYFAGLTLDETADVLGISPTAVSRQWTVARAWLFREIARSGTRPDGEA
jgi:RNA polymerase sigma factor (TIGR02999 family)